jgi:hypothetical protein
MELKDFVAATLAQIVAGVKEAQVGADGENVNAEMVNVGGGNLIDGGTYGIATRVDFDVSVTAETSGAAGAKLTVFGVGVDAGGDHKAGSANRICFSVPVRLPDGDKSRAEGIEQQRRDQRSRRRDRGEGQGGGWMGA